jgi:hypothetical protein
MSLNEGYIWVNSGQKEGLLDSNYQQIIPLQDSFSINWGYKANGHDYMKLGNRHTKEVGYYNAAQKKWIISPNYNEIWVIGAGDSLFAVQKGEKYGIMNQHQKWVKMPIYREIEERDTYILTFKNENYFKVLDSTAHPFLLNTYCKLEEKNDLLHAYKNKHYFEVFEANGRRFLAHSYMSLVNYDGLHFAFKNKKHFQVFDEKGKLFLPHTFKGDFRFFGKRLIELYRKGKPLYYNFQGKLISDKVKIKDIFVHENRQMTSFFVTENSKNKSLMGLMNCVGDEIIPSKCTEIKLNDKFFLVRIHNHWGMYDTTGRQIVPPIYDLLYLSEGKNKFVISKQKDKFGLLNLQGKTILSPDYQDIGGLPMEAIKVKMHDKWGILDTTGKTLIPCEYDLISEMRMGKVVAQIGGKCGLLSRENKWILPPTQAGMEILSNGFLQIKQDCEYALANAVGKQITPFEYKYIQALCEYSNYQKMDFEAQPKEYVYFFLAEKNDFNGVIDSSGKTILPFMYDYLRPIQGADKNKMLLIAKQNEKVGLINLQGEIIIPFDFQDIRLITINGKDFYQTISFKYRSGIIDENGKVILPPIYNSIGHNANGFKGNGDNYEKFYFDFHGNKRENVAKNEVFKDL